MEWRPIETVRRDLAPCFLGDSPTEYREALVYGPTWDGDPLLGHPGGQLDVPFTSDPIVCIAWTHEGIDYWIARQIDSSDWTTHIKPTHWMPVPAPPNPSDTPP